MQCYLESEKEGEEKNQMKYGIVGEFEEAVVVVKTKLK